MSLVHGAMEKFLDARTDDSYLHNSGLLKRTGTAGGAFPSARARSAPLSYGIGRDTQDIAARVSSNASGGSIDYSLQRRQRFEHGGHVFRTEQSSFTGSRCVEPTNTATGTASDSVSSTRSVDHALRRSQELSRQWRVSIHSDDAVNPPLMQTKIRANGCPAARDSTHERIFVRSKERPYYVSRAQLLYWQERRGRDHDIIGGHDIDASFAHPAFPSTTALPVYNNDPMGVTSSTTTAAASTSLSSRPSSSSTSLSSQTGRAIIASNSTANISSLPSSTLNRSPQTLPTSPSTLRPAAGRTTFRAILNKPQTASATTTDTSAPASATVSNANDPK